MEIFEQIAAIDAAYPWFFAFWAFVFGACWGSFFNVVIYRVPAKKSVVHPGSHCYACQAPIKWYDNIPILSWCILRGKARCCGAPFSIRYALIEALTGALFMVTWLVYGPSLGVVVSIWLFISLVLCNAFIDLDTQFLDDRFMVWGMMLGVLLSALYPELQGQGGSGDPAMLERIRSVIMSLTGAMVGSGLVLWIGLTTEKFMGRETMGFGDVILLGFFGAFVGWQGAVFSVFGGSIIGSIVVLPMLLFNKLTGKNITPGKTGYVENMEPVEHQPKEAKKADEEGESDGDEEEETLGMGSEIPFGPWLALGALLYILALKPWVDGYFASTKLLIFSPVSPY